MRGWQTDDDDDGCTFFSISHCNTWFRISVRKPTILVFFCWGRTSILYDITIFLSKLEGQVHNSSRPGADVYTEPGLALRDRFMLVMLVAKSTVLVLSKNIFKSHMFFVFFIEVIESLDFIFTQMRSYGPVHWTHIRNQSNKLYLLSIFRTNAMHVLYKWLEKNQDI